MRTMYIILSEAGWSWAAVVIPVVAVLLRRRRHEVDRGGIEVEPEVQSRS